MDKCNWKQKNPGHFRGFSIILKVIYTVTFSEQVENQWLLSTNLGKQLISCLIFLSLIIFLVPDLQYL